MNSRVNTAWERFFAHAVQGLLVKRVDSAETSREILMEEATRIADAMVEEHCRAINRRAQAIDIAD